MKFSLTPILLLCIGIVAWSLPARAQLFLDQREMPGLHSLEPVHSFSGSIQLPPDQAPINEEFDVVYTSCKARGLEEVLDPSCTDDFSRFGFYLTHTALFFDQEELIFLPADTHPDTFYVIEGVSLSYDAATHTVTYDLTFRYLSRCFGLGCAFYPVIIATLTANLEGAGTVQLLVRNVDQIDSCGSQSSAFRPQIRIINNTESPLPLNQYSLKMYFQNEAPIQFVNVDWVHLFDENGGYTGFGTAAPGPDEVLPEDTGCAAPAGGFCGCGATPARLANQARTLRFTSGVIPPLGHADVIVMYWRGGFIPFDFGCNDFSKLINVDPSRPFVDDLFFSLFSGNIRVAGLPLSGSVPECTSF